MGRSKRILPGSAGLLGMMALNGLVGALALIAVYALFGLNTVFAQRVLHLGLLSVTERWEMLWPLIPGAAISFACLWFCLIVVGRSRGVQWQNALFYGIGIAYGNVLLGGLLNGLMHGNPLMGLLLGFAMLLLIPANWAAMGIFGAFMGLLNARLAARWIDRHYPRP